MSPANTTQPTETDVADVVVIGGGVLGLFAALAAAESGRTATLVDQFALPHAHGSSHGDGRIYRMAYAEPVYLDLMARSLPRWRRLQAQSGAAPPLLAETGCLALALASHAATESVHTPPSHLPAALDALRRAYAARGLDHAVLDAAAVAARFPAFRPPPSMAAVHVDDGGILRADACLAAALARARALGVRVVAPFKAQALSHSDAESPAALRVHGAAERQFVDGRRVIVAPGAWLEPVARRLLGLRVPATVSEETVCYFAPREQQHPGGDAEALYDATAGRFPSFFVFAAGDGDGTAGAMRGVYGLPRVTSRGVKVAAHYCGPLLHVRKEEEEEEDRAGGSARNDIEHKASQAGERGASEELDDVDRRAADREAWDSDARPGAGARRGAAIDQAVDTAAAFVRDVFPGLDPAPVDAQQCLYTTSRDANFVLDAAAGWGGRVVVLGAGSGHAFKMAPALGECAVALAFGEEPPVDVSQFSIGRLVEGDERAGRSKEGGE